MEYSRMDLFADSVIYSAVPKNSRLGNTPEEIKESITNKFSTMIGEFNIIESEKFPFPREISFFPNFLNFFGGEKEVYIKEIEKLYRPYFNGEPRPDELRIPHESFLDLARFCEESMRYGDGFYLIRMKAKYPLGISEKLIEEGIPSKVLWEDNKKYSLEEISERIREDYESYSLVIQTIQKNNKGKIPKKGTQNYEIRKKYINKMKILEQNSKKLGIKSP